MTSCLYGYIIGVLELLEYVPPIVTEDDIKQFEKMRERELSVQVCLCLYTCNAIWLYGGEFTDNIRRDVTNSLPMGIV